MTFRKKLLVIIDQEVIMMAVNIIEIAELIVQEGKQAQKYEELIEKAQDEGFKKKLTQLRDHSVQQLNTLVQIVKDGPWGNWN